MNVLIRYVLECKGTEVEVIDADSTVLEAVQRMNRCCIGSLIVTDGRDVLGIITERDVLARVIGQGLDPRQTHVDEVMDRDFCVISPDATVADAMVKITDRRCRHLPVVEDGRLCGVVSSGDLTQWVIHDHRRTIAELEDFICIAR